MPNTRTIRKALWNDKFYDNDAFGFGSDNDVVVKYDGNQIDMARAAMAANSDRVLYIEGYPTIVSAGVRQGVLGVYMYRTTSYPLTTWDGNGDIAFRVWNYNYAANSTSRGGIRGAEILARNRTGSCSWVSGAYITAENYTGSAGVDSLTGVEVHTKNNGVAASDVKIMRLYDESQSATGTTYALEINCEGTSPFTREYAIYINSAASSGWTNGVTFDGTITNPLDFADTDGTNGATYDTGYTFLDSSCVGKIKVDIGGNPVYIPVYSAVS